MVNAIQGLLSQPPGEHLRQLQDHQWSQEEPSVPDLLDQIAQKEAHHDDVWLHLLHLEPTD